MNAIGTTAGKSPQVQNAIAELVKAMYGAEVHVSGGSNKEITADEVSEDGMKDKLKVELRAVSSSTGIKNGDGTAELKFRDSSDKGVKVTIKIKEGSHGSLKKSGGSETNNDAAGEIARRIAKAARKAAEGNTSYNPGEELLKSKMEFGIEGASVSATGSNNQVTVNAGVPNGQGGGTTVKITGGGDKFNALVAALAPQVQSQASGGSLDAEKLKNALNNVTVKTAIKALLEKDFKVSDAQSVSVSNSGNNVQVMIGTNANESKGEATVSVKGTSGPQTITIQVKGDSLTNEQGQAIANALALALLDQRVLDKLPSRVSKYAIGRSDFTLGKLAKKLYDGGIKTTGDLQASTVKTALESARDEITKLVSQEFGGATVETPGTDITVEEKGTQNMLKVELQPASTGDGNQIATGTKEVGLKMTGSTGVTVTIKIQKGKTGSLKKSGGSETNNDAAEAIAFS